MERGISVSEAEAWRYGCRYTREGRPSLNLYKEKSHTIVCAAVSLGEAETEILVLVLNSLNHCLP